MARVCGGSYPQCHWFDPRRHQRNPGFQKGFENERPSREGVFTICPHLTIVKKKDKISEGIMIWA